MIKNTIEQSELLELGFKSNGTGAVLFKSIVDNYTDAVGFTLSIFATKAYKGYHFTMDANAYFATGIPILLQIGSVNELKELIDCLEKYVHTNEKVERVFEKVSPQSIIEEYEKLLSEMEEITNNNQGYNAGFARTAKMFYERFITDLKRLK